MNWRFDLTRSKAAALADRPSLVFLARTASALGTLVPRWGALARVRRPLAAATAFQQQARAWEMARRRMDRISRPPRSGPLARGRLAVQAARRRSPQARRRWVARAVRADARVGGARVQARCRRRPRRRIRQARASISSTTGFSVAWSFMAHAVRERRLLVQ